MSMINQKVIPTAEPFLFPGNEIGCLLVHGFTGTPKEMRWLGEHLSQSNYTVLGIRLNGHATQPSDMMRTHWEDWLLSVEDGLHLLRCSCKKIFVIGLSMGGILSTIAASRFPVDGVALLSTPYQLPQDWRLKFLHILKFIVPEIEKGESDWVDPDIDSIHKNYPKYPTVSIGELSKAISKMHRSAPQVKVPVLLMQSKGDATVPVEHVQKHYADLGSQDKEIILIENSGHVITEDVDREVVFENITRFIKRNTIE